MLGDTETIGFNPRKEYQIIRNLCCKENEVVFLSPLRCFIVGNAIERVKDSSICIKLYL